MVRCRVPLCPSAFVPLRRRSRGVQYPTIFHFPTRKNPSLRAQWMQFCRLVDHNTDSDLHGGVCQNHFEDQDLIYSKRQRLSLHCE